MTKIHINLEGIVKSLETLNNIAAVTGHEDDIRNHIQQVAAPYATSITEDQMGNLIVHRKGAPGGLKIMISVHMDEIGYVVRSIDQHGYLHLYPLGGMPEGIGPGQWIIVHTEKGPVKGATGIQSPHSPTTGTPSLFADVGAENKHQAMAMGIKIGDPVNINQGFSRLNNDRVLGRCMDNRAGCAILLAVLKLLAENHSNANAGADSKPNSPRADIYAVFSSTEEHGMHPGIPPAQVHGARGAFLAAQKIKPHFAIVVDTMIANDFPGIAEPDQVIKLGQGVALRLVDDMSIMRPRVRKLARTVAQKHNINYQEGISRSFTDASVIQLTGAAVCTLGIPMRYIHSPGQVASMADIESTIRLVLGIIDYINTSPPGWLASDKN